MFNTNNNQVGQDKYKYKYKYKDKYVYFIYFYENSKSFVFLEWGEIMFNIKALLKSIKL